MPPVAFAAPGSVAAGSAGPLELALVVPFTSLGSLGSFWVPLFWLLAAACLCADAAAGRGGTTVPAIRLSRLKAWPNKIETQSNHRGNKKT